MVHNSHHKSYIYSYSLLLKNLDGGEHHHVYIYIYTPPIYVYTRIRVISTIVHLARYVFLSLALFAIIMTFPPQSSTNRSFTKYLFKLLFALFFTGVYDDYYEKYLPVLCSVLV